MKYIHEREIWLVNLDSTNGIEIQKNRPCLVLRKFSCNQFYILPITSIEKNSMFFYLVKNIKNLKNKSFYALSQTRTVDVSRFGKKMIGRVGNIEFLLIKKRLVEVLKLLPEPDGQDKPDGKS